MKVTKAGKNAEVSAPILDILWNRRKLPAVSRTESIVDATRVFSEIRRLLIEQGEAIGPRELERVEKEIARWFLKHKDRPAQTFRFTVRSIATANEFYRWLVGKHMQCVRQPQGAYDTSWRNQTVKFATRCIRQLEALTRQSTSTLAWIHLLDFVDSNAGLPQSDAMPTLKFPKSLGQDRVYDEILTGALLAIERGNTSELAELLDATVKRPRLRALLTDRVAQLLRDRGGILSRETQEWIVTFVGGGHADLVLEQLNPAESPEIRQAASLLLYIFDHSNESSSWREAYQRFRALCEKNFRLQIREDVGAVVDYDRRVHQLSGPPVKQVRVKRPWVELVDPPRSTVVIRGLVEPLADPEQGG